MYKPTGKLGAQRDQNTEGCHIPVPTKRGFQASAVGSFCSRGPSWLIEMLSRQKLYVTMPQTRSAVYAASWTAYWCVLVVGTTRCERLEADQERDPGNKIPSLPSRHLKGQRPPRNDLHGTSFCGAPCMPATIWLA